MPKPVSPEEEARSFAVVGKPNMSTLWHLTEKPQGRYWIPKEVEKSGGQAVNTLILIRYLPSAAYRRVHFSFFCLHLPKVAKPSRLLCSMLHIQPLKMRVHFFSNEGPSLANDGVKISIQLEGKSGIAYFYRVPADDPAFFSHPCCPFPSTIRHLDTQERCPIFYASLHSMSSERKTK